MLKSFWIFKKFVDALHSWILFYSFGIFCCFVVLFINGCYTTRVVVVMLDIATRAVVVVTVDDQFKGFSATQVVVASFWFYV